jgi:hypothetical protein
VQGAAQQVQERAHDVRGQAREQLTQQLTKRSSDAAEQIRGIANAFRKTSQQLRTEENERPAAALDQLATRGESLARYLEDANGDRMLRDVEGFARRQPWLFTGGALVCGLLRLALPEGVQQPALRAERKRSPHGDAAAPAAPVRRGWRLRSAAHVDGRRGPWRRLKRQHSSRISMSGRWASC